MTPTLLALAPLRHRSNIRPPDGDFYYVYRFKLCGNRDGGSKYRHIGIDFPNLGFSVTRSLRQAKKNNEYRKSRWKLVGENPSEETAALMILALRCR